MQPAEWTSHCFFSNTLNICGDTELLKPYQHHEEEQMYLVACSILELNTVLEVFLLPDDE